MDSHLYVDQYLRRKRGAAFPSTSSQQQQLAAAAHNAILAAANLRHAATDAGAAASVAPAHAGQTHGTTGTFSVSAETHLQRSLSEHADVVRDLAMNVQSFVERTDNLNLQVQTVEDKLLNLAKMLKVAQEIADDQNQSLAEQITEIRRSIDSVIEIEARTKAEFADLRSWVPAVVRDAVAMVKADTRVEVESLKASVQALEKQQLSMRAELLSSFASSADNLVNARIHQESERTASHFRDVQTKFTADLSALERDINARLNERKAFLEAELRNARRSSGGDEVTFEGVRRVVEERCASLHNQIRDLHQSELRQALLTAQTATRDDFNRLLQRVEDEVRDLNSRVKVAEEHNTSIEGSFHEFIGAFKEHTGHQAARMEETAVSMRELMELHDETRSAVAAELDTTKQWATRNMTRLKKHIDNTNVDITAIKDAHRDLHHQFERLRLSQTDERDRLTDLVEQRTREAAALSEMVDREIASVQNIARTYRTAPRGKSADAARTNVASRPRTSTEVADALHAAAAAPLGGREHSGALDEAADDDIFEKFAERTAARRQQMHALFSELKTSAEAVRS